MVSVRSRWQDRHGAWLIDTPPQMVSLTTDSPQRNATVITIAWPSVSEFVLRVRLGITVFCILTVPRVTLGITAEAVSYIIVIVLWHFCAGYQQKIPFVKSAPIEAEESGKSKKKQSAGGGGKKSTKVNTSEHPGGDIANAVVDGVNSVTLDS